MVRIQGDKIKKKRLVERDSFKIPRALSSPARTVLLHQWVFFTLIAADKHRSGCGYGRRGLEKETPIRDKKSCQPIARVSDPQAKQRSDGALGCQGSTESEGDKGGKAFTTPTAETFVLVTTKGTWQHSLVPIPN